MIGSLAAVNRTQGVWGVMAYGRVSGLGAVSTRHAAPETPVQPVRPAPSATVPMAQPAAYTYRESTPGAFSSYAMPVLPESYPAEQMNRARVAYPPDQSTQAAGEGAQAAPQALPTDKEPVDQALPWPGQNAAETLVRMRIQYGGEEAAEPLENEPTGAVAAQEAAEEGKCETCEKRKYQDGSDDSSVSYQTPTRIDPDMVASAVRGHEMEHVAHEQQKARQQDRKVVSQTVTLHTDICPECGKVYISGGTTRTVTKANPQEPSPEPQEPQEGQETPVAA